MWRRRSPTTVFAALVLAVQAARGWTMLFDVTAHCYYAVPPDWKVDEPSETSNGLAISPDGAVTASIRWSPQTWTRATAELRGLSQPKQVHDDTERRYWIEVTEPQQRTLHVAVIPATPGGACTIEVEAARSGRDDHRAIIPTLLGTLGSRR